MAKPENTILLVSKEPTAQSFIENKLRSSRLIGDKTALTVLEKVPFDAVHLANNLVGFLAVMHADGHTYLPTLIVDTITTLNPEDTLTQLFQILNSFPTITIGLVVVLCKDLSQLNAHLSTEPNPVQPEVALSGIVLSSNITNKIRATLTPAA